MAFRLYLSNGQGGWDILTPDDVDLLEARTLPGLLAHLAALQTRVAARLACYDPEQVDTLLTAEEVAERLRSSVDWVKHTKLPFRVKVSDGQVRYSARGLARYLKDRLA